MGRMGLRDCGGSGLGVGGEGAAAEARGLLTEGRWLREGCFGGWGGMWPRGWSLTETVKAASQPQQVSIPAAGRVP